MPMTASGLFLLSLFLQSPVAHNTAATSSQAVSEQAGIAQKTVDAFFPRELIDPEEPTDRASCYGIYESDAQGVPRTLIAVYPSGTGKMLLLKRQESGNYTATEIKAGYDFGAESCEVKFRDIDNDGKPEVVVSVQGNDPISANYVFRLKNDKAENIGPIIGVEGGLGSLLNNAWFTNYYNDGKLEVLSVDSFSRDKDAPVYDSVYKLQGGEYVLSAHTVYALPHFVGGKHGKAGALPDDFIVDSSSVGPYDLRIANGDEQGQHFATRIRVSINGKPVIDRSAIDWKNGSFSIALSNIKRGKNKISVDAAGVPGSRVVVAVEDQGKRE